MQNHVIGGFDNGDAVVVVVVVTTCKRVYGVTFKYFVSLDQNNLRPQQVHATIDGRKLGIPSAVP